MQSKLLAKVLPAGRNPYVSFSQLYGQSNVRQLATFPTGRSADPAVHTASDQPDDINAEEKAKYESAKEKEARYNPTNKSNDPFVPSETPFHSSPELRGPEVTKRAPNLATNQRKRAHSTHTLDEVSCVGFDGTPLVGDQEDWHKIRDDQQKDDIEYFKHHKASPLENIELADTRKPVQQATDGSVEYHYENPHDDDGLVRWRPEQMVSAEETLEKARRMWKEAAENGIPDLPHSRVLRALRGEL